MECVNCFRLQSSPPPSQAPINELPPPPPANAANHQVPPPSSKPLKNAANQVPPPAADRRRKCTVLACTFFGNHLAHHIGRKHVPLNIREDQVQFFANLAWNASSSSARLDRPGGRPKRICPVDGCGFITPYLGSHLANAHRMPKTSAKYKVHFAASRIFMEQKMEVDHAANGPPPPAGPPPTTPTPPQASTSTAAPPSSIQANSGHLNLTAVVQLTNMMQTH